MVEGPIDSLFLPNCFRCTSLGDLSFLNKEKTTIILDNESSPNTIPNLMNMYLRNDWKVVVWKTHWIGDDNDTFKDINDLIILQSPSNIGNDK